MEAPTVSGLMSVRALGGPDAGSRTSAQTTDVGDTGAQFSEAESKLTDEEALAPDAIVNPARIGGRMTFARWLYRRIGQIVCFALAAILLLASLTSYGGNLPASFGAAILFGVALSLRHQMIRRFYVK